MNAASLSTIKRWFFEGGEYHQRYMIVWCDDFDMSDYPVYYKDEVSAQKALDHPESMQRAMECYDLKADMDTQMNMRRAWALTRKVY